MLIAVMFVIAFRFLAVGALNPGPFGYDESDYMYAASRGAAANWTDADNMSLPAFIWEGLASRWGVNSTELSERIRETGDVHFYRHWHGPTYFYLLERVRGDERSVRSAMLWIPAIGVGLVYLAGAWLLPGSLAALMSASLYGFGYTVASTAELAPHQLFVVTSLASLFFLAKLEITRERRWWWPAVAAGAVSFVTMELAFVTLIVLVVTAWRMPKLREPGPAFWSRSVGLFVAVALALWPAGFLKLDPVRGYLGMVYLAVFRKGAWGGVTFSQTWVTRLEAAPLEWILFASALVLWWRLEDRARNAARPFLWFGMLMMAATITVYAVAPRYTLPFFAPLAPFTGIVIGTTLSRWKRAGAVAALGLTAAVAGETWVYIHAHPSRPDSRAGTILSSMRSHPVAGRRVLVPHNDMPMLHFYFPDVQLIAYRTDQERDAVLARRSVDAVLDPAGVLHMGDR